MDEIAEPLRPEPLVPQRPWPEPRGRHAGGALPTGQRAARLAGRATAAVRWETVGLALLLVGTGLLYTWDLAASGWANAYYSAAALAGSQDWSAWFWGSFDAGNALTVDKTPAALWVMGLSVRLFGLSSTSVLLPQALMGVAAFEIGRGSCRENG